MTETLSHRCSPVTWGAHRLPYGWKAAQERLVIPSLYYRASSLRWAWLWSAYLSLVPQISEFSHTQSGVYAHRSH